MTSDELFELLGFLESIRHYESLADNMVQEECDRCIRMVTQAIAQKILE